jgi:tetratricopeptide (TPR) repeat protein
MNRQSVLILLVVSIIAACAKDQRQPKSEHPGLTWYSSLDEALLEAQEGGDLVLMSFGADWCPWSRLVRESLFVSEAVVDSLSSFKCVAFDADRDTATCRELGISLYPTTVITDAYRAELGRIIGYYSPEEFLQVLAQIEGRSDRLAEMFRQEETQANDPGFLISFGRLLLEIGMYDAALLRFDRASEIDNDDQFGTVEEATYSMAECYMLAGKHREAGRRFRLFAESYPGSDRYEYATVLAALCYERVSYLKVAVEIYEEYLENPIGGTFTGFVTSRLDSLDAETRHGS